MDELMEAVVERENLWRAYARVMRNKGAAGIDRMPVADLKAHLQVHWPRIREELLAGRYRPSAGPTEGSRLRVPADVVQRFRSGLRAVFRRGRGRSLAKVIAELAPILRGWLNYFCDIEVKGVLEALDGWLRRKLRALLWRQWKRSHTRARNLMRQGLAEARAWTSATKGRGPWWNAGASHMNQSFPQSFFDRLGLVSLLGHYHRLQRTS